METGYSGRQKGAEEKLSEIRVMKLNEELSGIRHAAWRLQWLSRFMSMLKLSSGRGTMGRDTEGRGYPLYRVPFSSRKQSKPLQKVPLRPPPILSSCHLKIMWTRAYPDLLSLVLYPYPSLLPEPHPLTCTVPSL